MKHLKNFDLFEGKTMKSTTDKDTDVRKENFRKTISSLIKSKGCSHFWKMVTKNYYKCGWCDERHYC